MPLKITATLGDGTRFSTDATTVDVNLHGAKVRCKHAIPSGVKFRVTTMARRTSLARLVWRSPKYPYDCAFELENPENFWQISFPTDQYKDKAKPLVRGTLDQIEAKPKHEMFASDLSAPVEEVELPLTLPMPRAEREVSQLVVAHVLVPEEGMEVRVSGISAVRLPFHETVRLAPAKHHDGMIGLRTLVEPGTVLRILLPQERTAYARAIAVGDEKVEGYWPMFINFVRAKA